MVRTLWDRIVGRETENEASEKLVKALREHEKQWPEIEAAWQKADDEVVVPAAQVHSVALHTENPERILAAWDALMRARWDRDRAKGAWDRKRLALLGELEALTGPVIQEKWEYWQSSLAQLHGQRRIKEIERFVDMAFDHTPRRVRYKSNFPAIAEAKKTLLAASQTLREMRHCALSEIDDFIEKTEAKLKKLDFETLVEEKEAVSLHAFSELQESTIVEPKAPPLHPAAQVLVDELVANAKPGRPVRLKLR